MIVDFWVLWSAGPGVVHVQRPGRRVAGCGLRRRVRPLLLGGVVSPRSGADVSRLCVCL